MIDLRAHAALPKSERVRRLKFTKMLQQAAERQRAELLLAEAAVILLSDFGDQVGRMTVQTSPWQISLHAQAIITEVCDADGKTLWAALPDSGARVAWAGECEIAELVTEAWQVSSAAFRPVDEHKGLYEVVLHRKGGDR